MCSSELSSVEHAVHAELKQGLNAIEHLFIRINLILINFSSFFVRLIYESFGSNDLSDSTVIALLLVARCLVSLLMNRFPAD